MKTKNLFFTTMALLFGVVFISSAQINNLILLPNNSTIGGSNVVLGANAANNIPTTTPATTRANVFVGFGSANSTTSNSLNNVFVGYNSGYNNTTGGSNVFVGSGTGMYNSTSSNNTYLGYASGGTGQENTCVGYLSGAGTSGDFNVFSGFQSGYSSSGSANVFLGYRSGQGSSYSNRLVITGKNISPGSELIFGEFDNRKLKFNVNNGAGYFSSFVEITGNGSASGLRFTNLKSTNTANILASNGRVLTVNSDGDVVLTTDQGSGGSTLITSGTNISVSGTGVSGNPYVISSTASNCNLYSCDGIINTAGSTIPNTRTVTMGGNNLFFQTNPTDDGTGRVYIGASIANNGASSGFPSITATSRFRLMVEGGILSERVKVALRNTNNWADYVFAKDYQLTPLNEVETYIKENKHLPGIEAAETIVKEGLDLGDMQAKQMGKIEELTLYTIEQQKQLDLQAKEIEELKVQVKRLLEKK